MNDPFSHLAPAQRLSARPLAMREDFRLGNLMVRPSLVTIEGPAGSAKGEPRVIRVLLALTDAHGAVLSRDALLETCWDGLIVGDDAINRAVAELRRLVATTGGDIEVETVPRVGYRLKGTDGVPTAQPATTSGVEASPLHRRAILTGGAALAVAAVAGGAIYRATQSKRELDALVERGRVLQASGEPQAAKRAAALFRQAVVADPQRADAWGWLAVTQVGETASWAAAQRALALDPREPNARAVVAIKQLDLEDWVTYEERLLAIVGYAPDCALALAGLTLFYQGMGRCRESLRFNERAIAVEPFNPSHQARRAMKHWIFGDLAKADQVANRSVQLWPRMPIVWNARMIILAFTGRPEAAGAMLDDDQRPANLNPVTIAAWRATLQAIADGTVAGARRAEPAMMAAATQSPGMAANAIMAFSYLGLVDRAYDVADGLLTQKGQIIQGAGGSLARDLYSGPVWGRTQFLFVPACAKFRSDTRFTDLCRRTGHIAYWKARGIGPDPFVKGSLNL